MNVLETLLDSADIKIDGERDWDIRINSQKTNKPALFQKIMKGGSLAVGESYMEGEWDSKNLAETVFRFMRFADFDKIANLKSFLQYLKGHLFNYQIGERAFMVGREHYDIGNDLYEAMLDKTTMSYTSGYWKNAKNLDEAQLAKLDLICRKLKLKPGMRVLDIGCGWGNFMKYASENYGVSCVGLSVSVEQKKLGEERCKNLPVQFVLTDYATFTDKEKFDAVVSIEMIEAVGHKNFRRFFETISRNLKDEGVSLIQIIGNNGSSNFGDAFIHKYIFPNGLLPSIQQLTNSFDKKNNWGAPLFIVEDLHNFGNDYYLTLVEWYKNFEKNYQELKSKNPKYTEKFYRMWKYYLLFCAGLAKARKMQVWHMVISKKGVLGGYESMR